MLPSLNKLLKTLQDKVSTGDFELAAIKQEKDYMKLILENDIQVLKITYWITDNFLELDELKTK